MPIAPAQYSPSQTIWGLDALQLHAHYWASLGVQVVRQGEPSQIVPHAELFLLTDPKTLPLFRLHSIIQMLEWVEPHLITLRVHDTRERTYLERAISDENDRFMAFERVYDASGRTTRVMLTPERELAELWMAAPDPGDGLSPREAVRAPLRSRDAQRRRQTVRTGPATKRSPRS